MNHIESGFGNPATPKLKRLPCTTRHDAWQAGDNYDKYMARWAARSHRASLNGSTHQQDWTGWTSVAERARFSNSIPAVKLQTAAPHLRC
jgi:hypothetical protein